MHYIYSQHPFSISYVSSSSTMASFSSPSSSPSPVPLPPSVESLIQTICEEQSQPPPSAPARRELAALGEEQSLVLLGSIRSTRIKHTFDGFILYLSRKHSSSSSPAPPSPNVYIADNRPSPTACGTTNLSSPAMPGGAPPLSGRVEELIARICREQSQPPLGVRARRELEDMGEHEALKLLDYIRGRTITKSFDGFVMYMSRNFKDSLPASPSPAPTVESVFSSPSYPAASSSRTSNGTSFTGVDEITSAFRENFTVSTPRSDHNLNVKLPESHHLQELQRLEYRKAFLILTYIGRNRLEDVVPVHEIENLQGISSMVEFEDKAWNAFGKFNCDKRDRVKYLEWVSGKRYYYHCYVNSDGSYFFKGPYLNKVATHLQKVLGDDNVLIVKFCDPEANVLPREVGSNAGLTKFVEEGIYVGLRRFRYFVFKDGGKEKGSGGGVKCFFVNVDAFSHFYNGRAVSLDMKSMDSARCLFMHVHNESSLSSYMARFSLIVSKTITLDVNLDAPDVIEDIDDIPCKNDDGSYVYDKDGKLLIHTDGTGFISEELALRCPQNCHQGSALQLHFEAAQLGHISPQLRLSKSKQDHVEPPLLIQFRMFHDGRAVKGTVLVNKKLQGKKIQIRPSMIKVKSDRKTCGAPIVNSFEIVSTSNRPKKPRLSRFLIALLNYGSVPDAFFSNLLKQSFDEARDVSSNIRAALRVALNHGDMDDNYTVARMILSGIPLDEAYIQSRLPIFANEEKKSLKEGRLPISDSFYVMGTTDPTDSLCSDEVCIIHENGQISGDVLVYRHPGIHFGDIHVLRATYIKGIEEVVGNSKYGIFFPTRGPRSLADKMAGGDYDGDMYWVSRNPELLKHFKPSLPWIPTYSSPPAPSNKNPSDFSAEELERKLFDLFLTRRFQPSPSMSQAAHGWLAFMDRLLSLGYDRVDERHELEQKMLRLVDLYYEALDAPKKGRKVVVPPDLIPKRYPHFMGRGEQFSYKSESIMGYIFDKVDELQLEKPAVVVSKLPCLNIRIPLRCHASWQDNYKAYRSEMAEALKSGDESKKDSAGDVIQKYKQILYEADELDESPRAWEEIRFDALAIYHTTYDYAIQQGQASYCGFAWKVAGSALLRIFVEEQPEKPISCLPSVLKEVFG